MKPTMHSISQSPQDPTFVHDPYATYAQWHGAGLEAFWWDEYAMVCLVGYDAVDRAFRDPRFGRQILHVTDRQSLSWPERPGHLADFDAVEAHSLLELEPPRHTRLRRHINRAFVSRQVETLRPVIRKEAERLIDELRDRDDADLLGAFIAPLAVGTICRLLGVATDSGDQLLQWSHAMVRMYVPDNTEAEQHAANAAARDFRNWVEEQVASARKPGHDSGLISALLAADQSGNTLEDDEIVSTVILLLNAGHEATVHQFGNGLDVLCGAGPIDAETRKMVQTEPASVIAELLRLNPPLHMFTRYALDDLVLETANGPVSLRQGDQIGLLLGAANHDPRRFEAPARFMPMRPDQASVAFGAGIHFCIGAPLARIELEEAFRTVMAKLPGLRFANRPDYGNTYHFRGLSMARMRWD